MAALPSPSAGPGCGLGKAPGPAPALLSQLPELEAPAWEAGQELTYLCSRQWHPRCDCAGTHCNAAPGPGHAQPSPGPPRCHLQSPQDTLGPEGLVWGNNPPVPEGGHVPVGSTLQPPRPPELPPAIPGGERRCEQTAGTGG